MFIAALFTIGKTLKQHKCLLADDGFRRFDVFIYIDISCVCVHIIHILYIDISSVCVYIIHIIHV